ncbi:MAG TPA: caspase family protein [Bacteroides sp.]|nr:caspase family protein [Bacteroides sp.]
MRITTRTLTILLITASSFSVFGQSNYSPNQRVALVIGNSNYDTGPLLNPGNDARAMAQALRETNFEVLEYVDLATKADMKRAIREFGKKIQNGGVGLFYYAGHGIQVNGKNFLIPTKAKIYAEEEVEYESVDVGFALSQMEIARNRMNIIILDACRNNPFARSWRSAATGLAFINAPTGTMIAYSTSPGSVASDGTGSNGLYTEELLKQMQKEGMKIEDVFKSVRAEVLDKSNKQQTPWESSSLVGDFYFIKPEAEITQTQTGTGEIGTVEDYFSKEYTDAFSSNEKLEWRRGSNNNYFFFKNGVDISMETTAAKASDDILLYDNAAYRTYLLRDFYNIEHKNAMVPEEIFSLSNSFWKSNGENTYWFYLEGRDLSKQSSSTAYGDDYLIYVKESGKYYMMAPYKDAVPWEYYPSYEVITYNKTLWWANETYYYLYVDGQQIALKTWPQWEGNSLIVHDEESQSSYLFRDYYNLKDKMLRPAEILFRPGFLTCTRGEDNIYYLYKENTAYYMPSPTAYSNQDLLLYDTSFYQYMVFENYLSTPTNTHIVGKPIYSRNGTVWRSHQGVYYLYIRGVLQVDGLVTSQYSLNNSDLEVTELVNGNIWILKDYANRADNILRPAELKQ